MSPFLLPNVQNIPLTYRKQTTYNVFGEQKAPLTPSGSSLLSKRNVGGVSVKIKAPFVLSYDGEGKIRCWGYGIGPVVGWPTMIAPSYCIGGASMRLPSGTFWKWLRSKRGTQLQIESVRP